MSKLIIIDEGNIKHRSIFAWKNNPQIPPQYTYLRMIIGYLKKLNVTLEDTVLLAEDFGSWRKTVDPLYKAQRAALREDYAEKEWWDNVYKEFNVFVEKLDQCLPWNFTKVYHCESDDIASVAVRFLNDYDEKILISSDEDWQMLCAIPNVKIFSPHTKKFKEVKNPLAILAKKIKGDKSDNLLEAPKNEKEYEKRKLIVNLLELPSFVEDAIKEKILDLPIKNLELSKIPYRTCQEQIKVLYKLGEKR